MGVGPLEVSEKFSGGGIGLSGLRIGLSGGLLENRVTLSPYKGFRDLHVTFTLLVKIKVNVKVTVK